MRNLINASIFKLFRDRTFHVTAIIGVVVAVLMALTSIISKNINGHSEYLTSFAINGFGLTVPINLIVFTVGEFTYGTIRNKIIAGLSKTKIYIGLFITGYLFTLILMSAYVAICVTIGSIFGGFDPNAIGGANFILTYLLYNLCIYVFISAFSIFISTLFRQIGGSISIVVVLLVMLNYLPLIVFATNADLILTGNYDHWIMWTNPLHMVGFYSNDLIGLFRRMAPGFADALFSPNANMIAAGIITPLYWAAIFLFGGISLFNHRDIK